MSKAARVAPARLLAVPKRARPVMVNVFVGPSSRMRTCWPTLKWYFSAVPRSITTWFGVVGGCPGSAAAARAAGLGSKANPRVGAPPVVIAFPFGAMYCA